MRMKLSLPNSTRLRPGANASIRSTIFSSTGHPDTDCNRSHPFPLLFECRPESERGKNDGIKEIVKSEYRRKIARRREIEGDHRCRDATKRHEKERYSPDVLFHGHQREIEKRDGDDDLEDHDPLFDAELDAPGRARNKIDPVKKDRTSRQDRHRSFRSSARKSIRYPCGADCGEQDPLKDRLVKKVQPEFRREPKDRQKQKAYREHDLQPAAVGGLARSG